jgi:hypothetical protein
MLAAGSQLLSVVVDAAMMRRRRLLALAHIIVIAAGLPRVPVSGTTAKLGPTKYYRYVFYVS